MDSRTCAASVELPEPLIVRPQASHNGLEPVTSLRTVSTAPSENLDGNPGKRVGELAFSNHPQSGMPEN